MIRRLHTAYFSTTGRIGRLAYWLRSGFAALLAWALLAIGLALRPSNAGAFLALAGLAFALATASLGSLTLRRFQDHGRNGWLGVGAITTAATIIAFAQLHGSLTPAAVGASAVILILFVYLGFARGARGPNRFGPDPLDS